jgi:anti-anti-sigma regulatory factor
MAAKKQEILKIEEDLIFQNCSAVKEKLENASGRKKQLLVDLSEIKSFDLAGFQLIYALMKSAEGLEMEVDLWAGNNLDRFTKFLDYTGLSDTVSFSKTETS